MDKDKLDGFMRYGPSDFTPGHKDICSFQLSDPEDCPVCKTRPPCAAALRSHAQKEEG